MSVAESVLKPLGVRVTLDQHRVIREAAARENRSVASFVVNAAMRAAKDEPKMAGRSREEIVAGVRRAQELMRPFRIAGRSLVEELIAERRAEADGD